MTINTIKDSLLSNWKDNSNLFKLIQAFNNKANIKFVGGCIRNILLKIEINEIDFAIDCSPKKTIKILSDSNINYETYGIDHGTITAILNNERFEITSLRKDIKSYGRYAKVKFINDWNQDAARRDFTMNSLYLSPNGKIFDKFKGMEDINNSKIIFIGDAEKRIREDYLRIIRFIRFLGIFKTPRFDSSYIKLINKEFLNLKEYISNDKINRELDKILKNKFYVNSLLFLDNNLLSVLEVWWIKEKYTSGLKTITKYKEILKKF